MEYNLKNMPNIFDDSKVTAIGFIAKIGKWREGFERELREIVEKTPSMKCCKEHYTCGYIDMAKEILGE